MSRTSDEDRAIVKELSQMNAVDYLAQRCPNSCLARETVAEAFMRICALAPRLHYDKIVEQPPERYRNPMRGLNGLGTSTAAGPRTR
jgi:hypothetical protein